MQSIPTPRCLNYCISINSVVFHRASAAFVWMARSDQIDGRHIFRPFSHFPFLPFYAYENWHLVFALILPIMTSTENFKPKVSQTPFQRMYVHCTMYIDLPKFCLSLCPSQVIIFVSLFL